MGIVLAKALIFVSKDADMAKADVPFLHII